jgi:hypothetical protein
MFRPLRAFFRWDIQLDILLFLFVFSDDYRCCIYADTSDRWSRTHCVFSVRAWEIKSLNSIKWLTFVVKTQYVFCDVGTEFDNFLYAIEGLQKVEYSTAGVSICALAFSRDTP